MLHFFHNHTHTITHTPLPQALLLALCLWPYLPAEVLSSSPLPKNTPPPVPSFVRSPESVPHEKVTPTAAGLFGKGYLQQVCVLIFVHSPECYTPER
jgi:hypothetical protein